MNIVFFGSSNFAVPHLSVLLNTRHTISCVVTQPDSPKGRGLEVKPTPIKQFSQIQSLPICQLEDVNSAEGINFFKKLEPDVFVVVAYGRLLSQELLKVPKIIPINVHASLLPKYRGASPINWAIINGEHQTGITIIKMHSKMDAGPILMQKTYPIYEGDTSLLLERLLARRGSEMLLEALLAIENNTFTLVEQKEKNVTFAPKLKKEDGLINWAKPTTEIYNLVRGSLPWPGAYTYYKEKLLKIFHIKIVSKETLLSKIKKHAACGEITAVTQEGITVSTGRGEVMIDELQIEGKKVLKAKDFLLGHKIAVGEKLGAEARR